MNANPPSQESFPWLGLSVLSVAVFLSITAETLPMGLLPQLGADLGVSEQQVGLLVTVFAFTVVVTAPPIMSWTSRIPRKTLLASVILVLAVTNIATAVLPSYSLIILMRVLSGAAHGVFWSLVAAYAARLVRPEHIGRAVSITLTGGSLAFVAGIPAVAALGQFVDWRAIIAGIGVLLGGAALAVLAALPATGVSAAVPGLADAPADAAEAGSHHLPIEPTAADSMPSTASAARASRRGRDRSAIPVLILCAGVASIMLGHYGLYTYIVPFVRDHLGVEESGVSIWLFGYGAAGLLGLALAGTVLARRPLRSVVTMCALVVLALVILTLGWGGPAGAISAFLLWATAFGAIPPMLQTRMLTTSSDAFRDIASAFYTSAFNVGIGGGALVGSIVLGVGGVTALPVTYAALVIVGVGCIVVSARRSHSVSRTPG